MMTLGHGLATRRLAAALMVAGMALLLAACGGSGSSTTVIGDDMPGGGGGPMIELGEWNTLMPGTLDIGDANNALRAHYDESGVGHVTAAAPVQPAGMGTATWNGRWSGRIEMNPDPLASRGLGAYGVTPDDLARLEGEAQVTASFEGDGVKARLTYQDIGLDILELSEITSDSVPVTGGRFEPEKMYDSGWFDAETANPFDPTAPATITPTRVTGNFAGEGAFGGTDAAGVVGHMGGRIDIDYGRGPTNLGTFQSVFYGTNDEN